MLFPINYFIYDFLFQKAINFFPEKYLSDKTATQWKKNKQ